MVLPVYKGKSDPMECGSYRGIKLLEHAMKVVERIFEHRIRQQIEIDDVQFGFMMPFLWQDRCRRILELKVRNSILVLWIWRKDFQARKMNKVDAIDRCKWRKMIKDVR